MIVARGDSVVIVGVVNVVEDIGNIGGGSIVVVVVGIIIIIVRCWGGSIRVGCSIRIVVIVVIIVVIVIWQGRMRGWYGRWIIMISNQRPSPCSYKNYGLSIIVKRNQQSERYLNKNTSIDKRCLTKVEAVQFGWGYFIAHYWTTYSQQDMQ